MKNIQLSLKTKWFKMTESGEKTEDYREITPYWCNRFLTPVKKGVFDWKSFFVGEDDASRLVSVGVYHDYFAFKPFLYNRMTLGYPKKTDKSKLLIYAHAGIEIGTGRAEWGAEEGKVYFIIKHGNRIN